MRTSLKLPGLIVSHPRIAELQKYHAVLHHPDASKEEKHEHFLHPSRMTKEEVSAVEGIARAFQTFQGKLQEIRLFYSHLAIICHSIPDTAKAKLEAVEERWLEMDGACHVPFLALWTKPSVTVAATFPSLVETDFFDFDNPEDVDRLVKLYPLSDQEAIRIFLGTQLFAVYVEKTRAKKGKGGHVDKDEEEPIEGDEAQEARVKGKKRKIVHVTPQAATDFVERLKVMVDEEAKQKVMLSDLVRIYEMEDINQSQDILVSGRGSLRRKKADRNSKRIPKGEEEVDFEEAQLKEQEAWKKQREEVLDSFRRSQERLTLLQMAKQHLEELLTDAAEQENSSEDVIV